MTSSGFARTEAPLPHNIEAEQAVMGAALIDGSTVAAMPAPEDFYREAHQVIAHALLALHRAGEHIDLITVSAQLRRDENLELAGGVAYLDATTSIVQSTAHVAAYARIVAEHAAERRMAVLCLKAYNALLEGKPVGRVHPRMLEELGRLEMPGRRRSVELHEALDGLADDIDSGKTAERIFTGWSRFDSLTGGFEKRTVSFLGGDPGAGKTAWAMQLLNHVAWSYGSVAIISQEMGNRKLAGRNAAQQTGERIRKLDSDTVRAVASAAQNINFTIFDWQMTISQMVAALRSLKAKRPDLCLVAIDHAQLVAREPGQERMKDHELVAALCPVLRGLCQELDIVILVLCQLTREGRKRNPSDRPAMTDFLGGSAVEMTADLAVILWRDNDDALPEDTTTPIDILAGIVKNRDGPDGDVRLHFTRATTTFADPAARAQGQRRPATPSTTRTVGTKPDDEFEDVPF